MDYKLVFREIKPEDRDYLLAMMMELYMSPAVIHKPNVDLLMRDIDACFDIDIPLTCYVFTLDESIIGYSMIVKSFSTEYGLPCIWIEDLFIKSKYRNRGIGREYFSFIKNKYPINKYRIRLEVAKDNVRANRFYENMGMSDIEYIQKEFPIEQGGYYERD